MVKVTGIESFCNKTRYQLRNVSSAGIVDDRTMIYQAAIRVFV